MGFRDAYVPEDDEEWELMEDIHMATRRAARRGLDRQAIARVLAFMASAALDPASDVQAERDRPKGETLAERMERESDDSDGFQTQSCPECGDPIQGVVAEMGGTLRINPCGCEVSWENRDRLADKYTEDLEPE